MRSAYHIRNVEVFRLKQLAADPPQVAEMKFAQRLDVAIDLQSVQICKNLISRLFSIIMSIA